MNKKAASITKLAPKPPDSIRLTKMQAERLSGLSGMKAEELSGRTVAELSKEFKWRIDPELLLFRKICGQVVQTDPDTGIEYPVPFATVQVEDTDCSFLGYFPVGSPWHWFFPFRCHREVIGSAQTDLCGRFCVWIPRFDIDWILGWRLEKHCYWEIFNKPTIRDIIDHVLHDVAGPVVPPKPGPDPGPWETIISEGVLHQLETIIGAKKVNLLRSAQGMARFGQKANGAAQQLLNQPAFTRSMTPPFVKEMRNTRNIEDNQELALKMGATGEKARLLSQWSPNRYIGPFIRCYNVLVPEFVPFFDVPDITFTVTQDVNGDGTQEVIYGENYFHVRWNSGPIDDVVLHASAIAQASPFPADNPECQGISVPTETPAIVLAGLYPLHNLGGGADPYIDSATGYAQRPNRPHPHGFVSEAPPLPTPLPVPPSAAFFSFTATIIEAAQIFIVCGIPLHLLAEQNQGL